MDGMIFKSLLDKVNVPCHDDGEKFYDTEKIDVIKKYMKNTDYILTEGNLFLMYHKKPLSKIKKAVIVSSHIDFVKGIKKPFSKYLEDREVFVGTYDNSITNAIVLYSASAIADQFDDNVILCFTGNEEYGLKGAKEIEKYLKKKNVKYSAITLDVTGEMFGECAFTVENILYKDVFQGAGTKLYLALADRAKSVRKSYSVLIPDALEDESWEYSKHTSIAFSLCIPVGITIERQMKNKDIYDEMHTENGIMARLEDITKYQEAVVIFANWLGTANIDKNK